MSKQIFINLPVKNLIASTNFYEKLGFTKNPQFSNDDASAMVWSDDIFIMLLTHEFYSKFTNKAIPDLTQTSSALVSLTLDSKEEVETFAQTAKANGGSYFIAEPNKDLDFMLCYEVTDLDGHTLEPVFMDLSKFPGAGN
jgi:predicted lactoylglutathione lyase